MSDSWLVRAVPQSEVETGMIRADALISITASGGPPAKFDIGDFRGRVLRLAFDDIPVAAWSDHKGNRWIGPSARQFARAISFARDSFADGASDLVVHCLQGKSRSAAVALGIAADRLGPVLEGEAVRMVMGGDKYGQMCFNPGIVRMADVLLRRGGNIERALESACRPFVTWRSYWARNGCIPLSGDE